MAFEVIGCVGLIFVVCLTVERFRLFLFDVLKINKGIQILVKRCKSKIDTEYSG